MLRSLLNLKNTVQIRRITEASDGLGGLSTSTTLTTLSRANIWQPGGGDSTISDKITKISTHVLAMLADEYTFTDSDRECIYNGITYKITGHADNVASRNELVIVGLERLS
jgi:hypothetical protein